MFSVRNKLIRFIACWTAIHMASLKLMIIHSIGCSVKTIYFEAFIESVPESCFQLSGGDQMVLSFGCNGPLCMYDKIPDHVQTLAGKNWTTIALILGLQLVEKMWEVPSTRFSTPKIAGNADRGLDTK